MQKPLRLSIAMATFNGELYLREQLSSLLAQDRRPDEIIIFDDSSTDRTVDIAYQFKAYAPFDIRIFTGSTRVGYEKNFERAIRECTGDIIFLCDQDDYWYPKKMLVIERHFIEHEWIMGVVHDLDLADSHLKPTGEKLTNYFRSAGTLGHNCKSLVAGCGTAFRSTLRDLVMPIPELNYGHDRWIHIVLQSTNTRFVELQPLQLFRRHETNTSTLPKNNYLSFLFNLESATKDSASFISIYTHQAQVYRVLWDRLNKIGPQGLAAINPLISFRRTFNGLHRILVSYDSRIHLLSLTRLKRMPLALTMLFRGDYRHFQGIKSFLKDLIR